MTAGFPDAAEPGVNHLVQTGAHAIAPLGSTGESAHLSDQVGVEAARTTSGSL